MNHTAQPITRPGRHRVAGALALVVAGTIGLAAAASAVAAAPVDRASGSYSYTSSSGPKTVSVDAHGTNPVKGSWTFKSRVVLSGTITCLVVQGDDAYMFGLPSNGDRAAFLWLHDGGTPGTAGDEAVTFIEDAPGESPYTRADMESWCVNAGDGFPAPLFPLDSGNLSVYDAP
jgi:hypothetical protein